MGETPNEGLGNQLSALTLALGGFDTVSVHSNVGASGRPMSWIDKGGTGNSYAASTYEATAITALAAQEGRAIGYAAVMLTHGEADWDNDNYEQDLVQLWSDYNADLKAITGQAGDVLLLLSQQGTVPNMAESIADSTVAQWRVGLDQPGRILCTGPKYQYAYAADGIHLTASQYRRLGIKTAEVLARAAVTGESWRPLQPAAVDPVRRVGPTTIEVVFDVPNPPLAWEDSLPRPHQSNIVEWAKGRGFEVWTAYPPLVALAIADVSIDGSSVLIEMAAALPDPGTPVSVGYALFHDVASTSPPCSTYGLCGGTGEGRMGNLRDSDPLVGYDLTSVACNVTSGSSTITEAQAGGFATLSRTDLISGEGLPSGTTVMSVSGTEAVLSQPWTAPSGTATLAFSSDQRNSAVHFGLRLQ